MLCISADLIFGFTTSASENLGALREPGSQLPGEFAGLDHINISQIADFAGHLVGIYPGALASSRNGDDGNRKSSGVSIQQVGKCIDSGDILDLGKAGHAASLVAAADRSFRFVGCSATHRSDTAPGLQHQGEECSDHYRCDDGDDHSDQLRSAGHQEEQCHKEAGVDEQGRTQHPVMQRSANLWGDRADWLFASQFGSVYQST